LRHRALREGAWVFAGQAAVALFGLVGVRVLTELAPERVFGEASLVLGILTLGRNVFVAPFSNAQIKLHPELARQGRGSWFTRQITRYTWLSVALFLALGLPGYLLWRWMVTDLRPVLLAVLLGVLCCETAKNLRLNRYNAERRQVRTTVWTGIEAGLSILFSALDLWYSRTTEAFLLGPAVATVAVFTLFAFWVRPLPRDQAPPSDGDGERLLPRILRYGLPFIPMVLVSWVSNLADRYVIAALLGTGQAGLYVAAYSLASRPFIMISGGLTLLIRPILFEAVEQDSPKEATQIFQRWIGVMVLATTVLLVVIRLFGDAVARILLAAEYRGAAPAVFFWVGLGYGLLGVAQAMENRILSLGHSRRLVWPAVLTAVSNVALSFLLIPRHGIVGAAQATAASFFVYLGMLLLELARQRHVSRPSPSGDGA